MTPENKGVAGQGAMELIATLENKIREKNVLLDKYRWALTVESLQFKLGVLGGVMTSGVVVGVIWLVRWLV